MNRIARFLDNKPAVATLEPAAEPEQVRTIDVYGRGAADGALRSTLLRGEPRDLAPGDAEDWCLRIRMSASAFNEARTKSPCVARWRFV